MRIHIGSTINTTNGNIVAATNVTFTNSVGFSTNAQSATRTNLGLGATWLTNTNATNFRTAIGLGATWLTNTNVTNFRTAIGLGTTNNPIFSALTLGAGDELQINGSGIYSVGFSGQLEFETRTLDQNGLNVFAWSSNSFAVTPSATFATNVTVNGNLSVGSLTTTTPSTWALDATQTAAATNGILALPSNANVIRLTNSTAISGVSGGVLGAFYYLVNQTTNAVTISNVGGITVQGGTSLTLGANQAATLVATGATNASVAARGDLNDVALGGTQNTAPSQTASSGSSLMTRDLGDLRLFGQVAMLEQMSPAMGAVYNTNGASGSPDVNGFDMTTSTNSASSSFYSGMFALKTSLSGSAANTSWNGRVVAGWTFNRYNTNVEVRMQLGRDSGTTEHGPLSNRGIGIRINGNNLFFETHDGTTHFETTNAVALTHVLGTDVFWAVAQSGVLRFYRGESTLLATVTNNVPTTAAAENDLWSISISNTSTVSGGFRVRPSPGFVLQQ